MFILNDVPLNVSFLFVERFGELIMWYYGLGRFTANLLLHSIWLSQVLSGSEPHWVWWLVKIGTKMNERLLE